MNRASRGVIAAAMGFCATCILVTASELRSKQPKEQVVLGNLDVMQCCRDRCGPDFYSALIANDAYGWRCVGRRNGVWGADPVDFREACQLQYGSRARPSASDTSDASSWQCIRP